MHTLTKVVEKHTMVLTSHERRIKRMEDYLSKKQDNPLPLPKETDPD
jgi:hypothetical protein